MQKDPHSFLPTPTGTPAYHPPVTPILQTQEPRVGYGLPRSVPTLTIYANEDANLNAEASALCAGFATGICLRPPPAVRTGRPRQLWELGPGECCPIRPRPDKNRQLRFRVAPELSPPPGRYLLLPVAGAPERFSLLPG